MYWDQPFPSTPHRVICCSMPHVLSSQVFHCIRAILKTAIASYSTIFYSFLVLHCVYKVLLSAQRAITKYCRLHGLNKRIYFFFSSGGLKVKINPRAFQFLVESLLLASRLPPNNSVLMPTPLHICRTDYLCS